ATGSLHLGVNDNGFHIEVPTSDPLKLDFFGIATVDLSGYLDSNYLYSGDHFSLTAGADIDLGDDDLGASGSFSITLSDSGFGGSISAEGHAKWHGVGASASASGSFYISDSQVTATVTFTADFGILGDHSFSFDTTIGSIGAVVNN